MVIEHLTEAWAPVGTRDRTWMAWRSGSSYILRYQAVLGDEEELTEYPPTVELTSDEWRRYHDWFGLTINREPDGEPKAFDVLITDLREHTTIRR